MLYAPPSSVYDPRGRLFQTIINGVQTQFLYDGDALVAEYDGSGNVKKRYVHGDQVDEPLIQYIGSAFGSYDHHFLHKDHQGSIIAESIYNGTVSTTFAYDTFGIPASLNVAASRFGYTGQQYFPEIGLNYYKARWYSPKIGRFLQTDPIGYADSMNMYAYTGNDPINSTDPSGLNKVCTGDTTGPNGEKTSGNCKDDGKGNDKEDEVVVTGKKIGLLRHKGPEQFFSVNVDGMKTFDAESAETCTQGNSSWDAYHTSSENFAGGDPGHTHTDEVKPQLGPDDYSAANITGRAYVSSNVGIVRVERGANKTYSATLVQGGFGASDQKILDTLNQFNEKAKSGSTSTGAAQKAGNCKPKATH